MGTGLEIFQKTLEESVAGDNVGVLLRGVQKTEVQRGIVLANPGSITPHTNFEAQVYVRTTDVTGKISAFTSDDGTDLDIVLPGDRVRLSVELIHSVAIEKGIRFAIREGGRAVGAGVIFHIP